LLKQQVANDRLIQRHLASLPDRRFFDRLQNVPHGGDAARACRFPEFAISA
jgi:hypothetical protein